MAERVQESEARMKVIRLVNTKGKHNKFYELWSGAYVNEKTKQVNSAFVGMKYGRIGTYGRVLFKEFAGKNAKANALIFLETKLDEKLGRGYKQV